MRFMAINWRKGFGIVFGKYRECCFFCASIYAICDEGDWNERDVVFMRYADWEFG